MLFLNPIVISKKIYSENFIKLKAFIASIFIHTTLLVTLLQFVSEHTIEMQSIQEEPLTISLSAYTPSSNTRTEVVQKEKVPISKPHKEIPKSKSLDKKIVQTPQKILPKESSTLVSSEAFTPPIQPVEPVANTQPETANTSDFTSPSADTHLSQPMIKDEELARIRLMIQSALTYPAIAKKLKLEGVVFITFSLSSTGHVENLQLLKSSGSSTLDKRALQTVSSLDGEYPQLSKKVDLKIPISFSLQNS